MSVFKAIIKSIRSNMINIIVYFSIFAFFGNITARANVTTTDTMFEEVTMNVAVTDYDNSNISKAVVSYLKDTQKVVDPQTEDTQTINDNVRFGIYQYAIIIPEGFGKSLKAGDGKNELEYIAPGTSASEYLLTQKINDYLNDIVIYMENGYTENEAIELTHQQMVKLNDTKAIVNDKSDENHRSFYTGMFTFNGYSMMMILCICVSTALISFTKDKDVSNRISVSGMTFKKRNFAIIGAVAFFGFVLTTVVIFVIHLASGEYANDKLIYYAINAYVLMFVGLGVAYLFSTITSSENLINMLSNMFIISMSFLCGVFVDIQFLSESIIKAAHFLPLYWYVAAIKFINNTATSKILCKQFGMYLLIEILFAFAFFAAGMIISKKKEQYAI